MRHDASNMSAAFQTGSIPNIKQLFEKPQINGYPGTKKKYLKEQAMTLERREIEKKKPLELSFSQSFYRS
jgi:hypothetical protein